jgi:hypothetical protein
MLILVSLYIYIYSDEPIGPSPGLASRSPNEPGGMVDRSPRAPTRALLSSHALTVARPRVDRRASPAFILHVAAPNSLSLGYSVILRSE